MKASIWYVAALCCVFSACSGCSKSGRIRRRVVDAGRTEDTVSSHGVRDSSVRVGPSVGPAVGPTVPSRDDIGKTSVKMEKRNGVYQIPVTINGSEMYFIFDTGAGMI